MTIDEIQQRGQATLTEDAPPYLHLHGQSYWHDPVFIVGTEKALRALRDRIDAVLEGDYQEPVTMFCSDGEGYEVHVLQFGENAFEGNLLYMPYTDPIAQDEGEFSPSWPLKKELRP
jgi:hypothetical protein